MKCYKCQAPVDKSDEFCQACGISNPANVPGRKPVTWMSVLGLVPVVGIIPEIMNKSQKDNSICPSCRKPINKNDEFCQACGLALKKSSVVSEKLSTEQVYVNPGSEINEFLKSWSWGAAAFSIIWGIFNGVWISFLALVPFVSMIWWIVLGVKGHEWAFKAKHWNSPEEFMQTQRRWNVAGKVLFLIYLGLVIFAVISGVLAS